jgi:hypothetical protein
MDQSTKTHLAGTEAATAMAYAMYPYTFGIVQDDAHGNEGRDIGTGIGIRWKKHYLILTAAHTVQQTPEDRLYFFLPSPELHVAETPSAADPKKVQIRKRVSLVKAKIFLADDDLAAVLLPEQEKETSERHFYELDGEHSSPKEGTYTAVMGYPAAKKQPFGENYMATPYHDCGAVAPLPANEDPSLRIAVTYSSSGDVDPDGLSGSGIWYAMPEGKIWVPNLRLAGLVSHYDKGSKTLLGYKVEILASFLDEQDELT